ncbi:APC family permease [Aspergillus stella-maris]|uniref:APC family permease n=1 Tax=Aspergillus stella-maris TaxID=1810926 RepID=UPI003CCE254A
MQSHSLGDPSPDNEDESAILLPRSQPAPDPDNETDTDNGRDDNEASSGKHPRRHLGLLSTTFLITNRMIGTAIFSVPSSISSSVGSAGATLLLWLAGLFLAYCGMFIWIELGSLMPRSGGEKVYLERAFPRPAMLVTTVFMVFVVGLGFTGIGSVVVAENILLAINGTASDWVKRALAIGVLALIATIHIKSCTLGVKIMNILATSKILILCLIILSGLRALAGDLPQIPSPGSSLTHPFENSSTSIPSYTNALFKILATYQGWSNAAYVLDEVQNPRVVLKIAGLVGVGSVGILYILTNISYFIVATPEEISRTGVTVVALLIGKVFGETMLWATALLAAFSSFGNLMTASFSMARVVREFAREGVLPFSGIFVRRTKEGGPSWAFGLVFAASAGMILFIPFGEVYNFLLDVGQYAVAIINVLVILGLFIIRRQQTQAQARSTPMSHPKERTFRAWTPIVYIFLASQMFLLITPFVPAATDGNQEKALPSWLYAVVAIFVFLGAGVYWFVSWVVVPRRGGFAWKGRKEVLPDGEDVVLWDKVKVR